MILSRSLVTLASIASLNAACSGGDPKSGTDTGSGGTSSSATTTTTGSTSTSTGSAGGGSGDIYQAIFDSVDKGHIQTLLGEMTGVVPVTVDGSTFSITNRWSAGAKANFRAYWRQYFTALGATVNELPFPIAADDIDPDHATNETTGHDMEAILPGESADSVVVIVHYDTVGLQGMEETNPGADDDGSGLAMQMEAARIFATYPSRKYTLRFVAADYEEISDDLAGDVAYVDYLQKEAAAKGFTIVVAADDDQTGWSCWSENRCNPGAPAAGSTFKMVSCSGDALGYDYPELTSGIEEVAKKYSTLTIHAECDGAGDTDHYPFWQANLPGYVIEELDPDNNPHYDDNDTGDDTIEHVDLDYLLHVSQIAITFQAKLAGIGP